MTAVVFVIDRLIQLYILLIIVWVFSSWFPQWRYQAWFKVVNDVVEPYMSLFRGLNLSYGSFDFSAILAIITLQVFRFAIIGLAGRMI